VRLILLALVSSVLRKTPISVPNAVLWRVTAQRADNYFERGSESIMSHRTGNTKEFDKRWRKERAKKKAAAASRRKNRNK
jgi:hypothetical protein